MTNCILWRFFLFFIFVPAHTLARSIETSDKKRKKKKNVMERTSAFPLVHAENTIKDAFELNN